MNYSFEPCNSDNLTGLVSHFFRIDITAEYKEWRQMISSGRQYILFFLSGEVKFTFRKETLICNRIVTLGGISDYCFSYHAQPGTVILGVSLAANALYKLFGCDLRRKTEPKVESREFLKSNELQEVLNSLVSIEDRKEQFGLVEKYLISKIPKVTTNCIDDCVLSITDAKGDIKIAELADELDVDQEFMQEEFTKQIGLSPKEYISLIRFKHAFSELINGTSTVHEVIAQYNYRDYAHLHRDFKQYIGQAPKNLQLEGPALYNLVQDELRSLGIQFLL